MGLGINLHRDGADADAGERVAFREALGRWGWDGTEGSPYQVASPSEIGVDVYAESLAGDGPFDHASLEVHDVDVELCELVLDLARAGGFTINSDADPQALILTDESQRATVADEWPRVLVCGTPDELYAALTAAPE